MVEGSRRALLACIQPAARAFELTQFTALWSLSQDKRLTCQTLRVLRPGELAGPGKVTQLTLEASSSFPQPQTAGDG